MGHCDALTNGMCWPTRGGNRIAKAIPQRSVRCAIRYWCVDCKGLFPLLSRFFPMPFCGTEASQSSLAAERSVVDDRKVRLVWIERGGEILERAFAAHSSACKSKMRVEEQSVISFGRHRVDDLS